LLLNRLTQWGKPPLDRLTKIVKDPFLIIMENAF
jgi:hypothetical protein